MATNYTSIQITDGTTTADLTDGTNYSITEGGWSPKIARLREAGVGGQSTHEDVVEEIRFSVFATSITTALSKFATIQALLDQARQYVLGESVTPVEIQVEPQGTTSNEWRAMILGGELILPETWADNLVNKSIEDCVVRIIRRGVWLKTSYSPAQVTCTPAVTTSAVSMGATLNNYSPLSFVLRDFTVMIGSGVKSGYVAVANAANKLLVLDSTSATLSGTTSTQAKGEALGGNVARLQSSGKAVFTVSGLSSTASRVALFASVKHTTPASDPPEFTVSVYSSWYSSETWTATVKPTLGQVTFCGVFEKNALIDRVSIARISTDIDVDYVALVQVDDPNTFIIDFESPNSAIFTKIPTNSNGFGVDNLPLSARAPYGYIRDVSANKFTIGVLGDSYLTTNGTVHALWMAQGRDGASETQFRPQTNIGGGGAAEVMDFYATAIQGSIALT